jgi:hypothetical protein
VHLRSRLPRLAIAAVLTLSGALMGASAASASPSQVSMFQDDNLLVFNTPQGTATALDKLQSLGVKAIRVSLFWGTIAPDPQSRTPPANFNAADPADYPAGAWDRYDQVIEDAQARGISVEVDITSPAPEWATQPNPPEGTVTDDWYPSDSAFQQFVQAVATRYSGTYVPPTPVAPPSPPPPCNLLQALLNACPRSLLLNPQATVAQSTATTAPLPHVTFWSIWNEPNQPGWLDPQWVSAPGGGYVEASPELYRGLLDAAWSALQSTGHGSDTILVGETAPNGDTAKGPTRAIKLIDFVQNLYCVGRNYRPLSGSAAAARGCPTDAAETAQFAAANPALFRASGFAHHPYQLTSAPNVVPKDPGYATIADLGRLTTALRRARDAYGAGGAMALWLTEFGYNTNPPDPAGVSLAKQALYLNEAEYIAFENSSVRSTDQFLLQDSATAPSRDGNDIDGTFQTGLEFSNGKPKPSLAAYEVPIFLPTSTVRRGRSVLVWGMVRPPRRAGTPVELQYRASHGRRWTVLKHLVTDIGPGYVQTRVHVSSSGLLRLAWRPSAHAALLYSRSASVTVRRR